MVPRCKTVATQKWLTCVKSIADWIYPLDLNLRNRGRLRNSQIGLGNVLTLGWAGLDLGYTLTLYTRYIAFHSNAKVIPDIPSVYIRNVIFGTGDVINLSQDTVD